MDWTDWIATPEYNAGQVDVQKQNDQQYQNVLAAYANQKNQLANQYAGTNNAWNDLYAQQAGYGRSQELALGQQYQRNLGATQQSMVSRGLGNMTVLDSAQRGNNYDYANSLLSLQDQLLQRQNSIKANQLGYQAQSQQLQGQLAGQILGFQGSYAEQLASQEAQRQNLLRQQEFAAQQQYNQNQLASTQFDASQRNQFQMQKNQFNQQDYIQKQYGYYAKGGTVPPGTFIVQGDSGNPGLYYGDMNADPSTWTKINDPPGPSVEAGKLIYPPGMTADSWAKSQSSATAGIPANPALAPNAAPAPMTPGSPRPQSHGPMFGFDTAQLAPVPQQASDAMRQYGYYAAGGDVMDGMGMPPPRGADTVPARLEPGEFVLSKNMIHSLETGDLDRKGLLYLIKSGK